MKKADAQAVIYLDELRPKKNGNCSVKIKITFNRNRRYYKTGVDMLPEEFYKLFEAKRLTKEQREIFTKIDTIHTKAKSIIDELNIFTFDNFEKAFFEQRNIHDSVSFAFDRYIEELIMEERIGTASSYQCAKNSLESFKKNMSFAEITPSFLKLYENDMKAKGKSITTIGIYLRSLRTIINLQNISPELYPFGEKKGKYSIPKGRNTKKALTIEEITKIFNYATQPNSAEDRAKDYWMFLYLCNGMNVKDFCMLRWENIEGNVLKYKRAKTMKSKSIEEEIPVSLKPETMEILKKWAMPSLNPKAFIFPHIDDSMSAERQREIYQQLTKTVNKYMNRICTEIGINKKVTTYFARHSFATVLKRAGVQVEMISELLGHSSVQVTKSYLDSFENNQIHEKTDVLRPQSQTA